MKKDICWLTLLECSWDDLSSSMIQRFKMSQISSQFLKNPSKETNQILWLVENLWVAHAYPFGSYFSPASLTSKSWHLLFA